MVCECNFDIFYNQVYLKDKKKFFEDGVLFLEIPINQATLRFAFTDKTNSNRESENTCRNQER